MKKLILIACALALPLAACDTTGQLSAPATVANTTKADEQTALTFEYAYKAWRVAVETGVNAGSIKGQLAGKVAALDNQLYSALQTVESAYATGNSASINDAVANFQRLLATGYVTIGSK